MSDQLSYSATSPTPVPTPKRQRVCVVTVDGNFISILGSCDSVVEAKKLLRTMDHGVYSIVSFNELDVPVRPPERISRTVVGKGQTFGKARGPRDPSKPRAARKPKSSKS